MAHCNQEIQAYQQALAQVNLLAGQLVLAAATLETATQTYETITEQYQEAVEDLAEKQAIMDACIQSHGRIHKKPKRIIRKAGGPRRG